MPETNPKKILLVDDEEEILSFLTKFLERYHYKVFSTTKGREAIGIVKDILPDLVILDILIPDVSGEEVAKAFLQDPSTSSIPVIFLSGLLSKEETAAAQGSRRYFLPKPISSKSLLALIEDILSIRKPD